MVWGLNMVDEHPWLPQVPLTKLPKRLRLVARLWLLAVKHYSSWVDDARLFWYVDIYIDICWHETDSSKKSRIDRAQLCTCGRSCTLRILADPRDPRLKFRKNAGSHWGYESVSCTEHWARACFLHVTCRHRKGTRVTSRQRRMTRQSKRRRRWTGNGTSAASALESLERVTTCDNRLSCLSKVICPWNPIKSIQK